MGKLYFHAKAQCMKNLFDPKEMEETLNRIEALGPDTQALWGKMNVAQMLAHLCVSYEMTYTDKHPRPGAFARFMLKAFVKKAVVGPKPYPKNSRTAPQFIIADEREFNKEKQRLVDYIKKTQDLGAAYFEGKEYVSFGKLSSSEWNTMFSKHLDHHLSQFGV